MGGAEWGEVGRRKSGGDGEPWQDNRVGLLDSFHYRPPSLIFFLLRPPTIIYYGASEGKKKQNACDSFFFSSGALESEGTGSRVNFPPPGRKRTASVVEDAKTF